MRPLFMVWSSSNGVVREICYLCASRAALRAPIALRFISLGRSAVPGEEQLLMPAPKSLQELTIAFHFAAPLSLAVVDLADWVTLFQDYPVIQQLPELPRINLPVPGSPLQMQFQVVNAAGLPRMLLRTPNGRYSVQLQDDRFGFSWHRIEPIGEPAEYGGFDQHKRAWAEVLERFEHWIANRFRMRPSYRLVELNYVNAAPLKVDGKMKRLSDVFTFIHMKDRTINAFNVQWNESVETWPWSPGGPVKGVVSTHVGLGTAPPALPVLAFTFSGHAAVAEGEKSEHILDLLHSKIREIYAAAIVQHDN
jgi:uncharacterized protein (TIGR04255 family)